MKATIEEVFPDKDSNTFLIQMFEIIEYRKRHPLQKIKYEERGEDYIYNERHHIIPQNYCKYHNVEVDESSEGTVNLKFSEHILVHLLLKKYFLEKKDYDVGYANAKTISYMCGKNKDYIEKVEGINQNDRNLILEILDSNKQDLALASKHQFEKMSDEEKSNFSRKRSIASFNFWKTTSDEYRKQFGNTISNSLRNRPQEKKDLQYKHAADTRANWDQDMKDKVAQSSSEVSSRTWRSYSEEERKDRCDNISKGTKTAMDKISPERKAEMIRKSKIGLAKAIANRSEERTKEISETHRKYHTGSRAMSNDDIHHWRYVCKDEQDAYLKNGYVFGKHDKIWQAQGMVKIGPGRYGYQKDGERYS